MKFLYLILLLIFVSSFSFAGTLTTTKDLDRNTFTKPIQDLTPSTDNIKIYDSVQEKITVKEKDTTPVATVKLLTPKNFKVGIGYQLVAEFEITSQQAYLNFLNQMYFYNVKTGNTPIKRSFDIKEKINYYESVPTYETTCTPTSDKNLEKICTTIQKGTHLEQRTRYDLYTGKDFPVGETKTLSVWTNTIDGESVEWIPEIFGVIADEWATWDASLNTNLKGYWKLDDTNTSTNDSLNLLNGTNTGVDVNGIPFLYGNSYYFNAGSDRAIDLNGSFTPDKNFTVNVWIKTATSATNRVFSQTNTSNNGWIIDCGGTGNAPRFLIGTGAGYTLASDTNATNTCDSNNWRMITGTYDGNSIKLYVDGVFAKDNASAGIIYASNTRLTLGAFYNGATYVQSITGLLDEASVWDRVLTSSDITTLWGTGAGMTYTPSTPLAQARVTFNVYRKDTGTNLTAIGFDANVDALDLTNQTSPFSTIYYDGNTSVSAIFSRAGYDSNTITFVMDSNKTITVYLTDSTAPSVGNTLLTDFNISTTYINGTGIASATATDSGSDINSTGCYYSINNGTDWLQADKNASHCYKSLSITNTGTYQYRFKVIDNATNQTINTASSAYTGDLNAPNTTFSYSFPNNDNNIHIILTCVDIGGAGCNYSKFRIDSTGWQDYNTNVYFNISGGTHTIDYNSRDNVNNTETIQTGDINGNVRILVKYPKNEATVTQITEKWNLTIVGGTNQFYSDLNTDKNVFLPYGQNSTLTIVDANGNYFPRTYTLSPTVDTNLQPYLIPRTGGFQETIQTQTAFTLTPIGGIRIKIYTDLNIGTTLVEEVVTDSTGKAVISVIGNQAYRFDVYQDGNIIKSLNINGATTTGQTIYIDIPGTQLPTNPLNTSALIVNFLPVNNLLFSSNTDLNQQIILYDANSGITITSIIIYITNTDVNGVLDNDVNIFSQTILTPGTNYTNFIDINYQTQLINDANHYDTNGYLVVYVLVNTTGGSQLFSYTYKPFNGFSITNGLSNSIKPLFGCSATADPLIPCAPLLLFALFISILVAVSLSASFGYVSLTPIGIMFLFMMGIFTFFTWVPSILFGIMFIGTLGLILAESGRRI